MSKQSVQFKTRGFNFAAARLVNATGTTITTVIAAGSNDSIVKSIIITSDEPSTARAVKLYVNDGTNNNLIDTIPVPALAGADGTVIAVDGLRSAALPLDLQLKKILPLKTGCTLKVAMVSAVTSTQTVTVSATLEDY